MMAPSAVDRVQQNSKVVRKPSCLATERSDFYVVKFFHSAAPPRPILGASNQSQSPG